MSAFKIHCARAVVRWLVSSVGVGAMGLYFRSGVKKAGPFLVLKAPMCATHSYEYLWQSFMNSVDS